MVVAEVGTKRPKDRRAQVALAAAELFCERGYHGVGIDDIAAAVGISGPALYRHFPNKYAILVHATRSLSQATLATATSADLDDLLAALAGMTLARRKVGRLYQWEWRYLTPEHRAEFQADLATLIRRLTRPLRRLRPELGGRTAETLAGAALSVLGSVCTHRAAIARGRGEAVLQRAAWAVLRLAPAPVLRRSTAAPGPGPVPALGGRREVLLAEAVRLFRRDGYHAVGVEDIGRAAGINASSVYRYFPGKAELLAAAYYRASERLSISVGTALASGTGAGDRLDHLIGSYVSFAFDESDLVSVYLAENASLPEPDRHELRKTQRLHVEEWVRLLGAVRPELPAGEARVLVHAALNLVTDLGRAARFDRSTGMDRELSRLALAVLHS